MQIFRRICLLLLHFEHFLLCGEELRVRVLLSVCRLLVLDHLGVRLYLQETFAYQLLLLRDSPQICGSFRVNFFQKFGLVELDLMLVEVEARLL